MKLKSFTLASIILFASHAAQANSSNDASQGSKHLLIGSGKLVTSSVKVAASAVAVPLVVAGSVGAASLDAGSGLIEFATGDDNNNAPLPIGEETIITSPAASPKEALKQQNQSDKQQGI